MRTGVRILRPDECKRLINVIPKQDYKTIYRAMLFSGMRFVELQRFQKHPSWFDSEFVNLPHDAVHKHKRTQLERSVRLNPIGRMAIEHFLKLKIHMPSYQSWNKNLARWGFHAELHGSESFINIKHKNKPTEYVCQGLSVKHTRKTYESWLVYYYPNRITEIILSQGHNQITSIQHYLNMPFNEHDKLDMKEFVEGWID